MALTGAVGNIFAEWKTVRDALNRFTLVLLRELYRFIGFSCGRANGVFLPGRVSPVHVGKRVRSCPLRPPGCQLTRFSAGAAAL